MTATALLDYTRAPIQIGVSTPIEAGFRAHACEKEPWTVAWIEALPADAVLYDVGANVGSYSLIAAACGLETVAIEPGFANYAALCKNLIRNRPHTWTVTPLCVALGSDTEMVVLPQATAPGYATGDHPVPALQFALADLVEQFKLPRPTHLKIDVDGAELDVMLGIDWSTVSGVLVEVQPETEMTVTQTMTRARHFRLTARHAARGIAYLEFAR